jgi:hypothetical protein
MVPALESGASHTFALERGDVLNLEAVGGGDLTGTRLSGDQPFAVFVGHEAALVVRDPLAWPQPCCLDHLEEQLLPYANWGRHFAIAKSARRVDGEEDLVRLLSRVPADVTFDPPRTECAHLEPNVACDLWLDAGVELTSTAPLLVAHYLSAVGGGAGNPLGDPSIAFVVPAEQYRTTYSVLVPAEYEESHLSIIARAGQVVTVDGVDRTAELAPLGTGTHLAAALAIEPGPHTIECPDTCGVEIYGYGPAVSYLYAGGLDLEPIALE